MNNHSFHGRVISKKMMGEGQAQRLVFTVAVRNKLKNKDGSRRDDNMHPCVAFGNLAGMIDQYIEVGQGIIVSNAEFTSSSKKNEDGTFVSYYNFVVSEIDFPVQNKMNENRGNGNQQPAPQQNNPKPARPLPMDEINPEDIPF